MMGQLQQVWGTHFQTRSKLRGKPTEIYYKSIHLGDTVVYLLGRGEEEDSVIICLQKIRSIHTR